MGSMVDNRAPDRGADRRKPSVPGHRHNLGQADHSRRSIDDNEYAERLAADDLACHATALRQFCDYVRPPLDDPFGVAIAEFRPGVLIHPASMDSRPTPVHLPAT